jgi:hypothetical protein
MKKKLLVILSDVIFFIFPRLTEKNSNRKNIGMNQHDRSLTEDFIEMLSQKELENDEV